MEGTQKKCIEEILISSSEHKLVMIRDLNGQIWVFSDISFLPISLLAIFSDGSHTLLEVFLSDLSFL